MNAPSAHRIGFTGSQNGFHWSTCEASINLSLGALSVADQGVEEYTIEKESREGVN